MKQESDFRPINEYEVENNNDGSCDVILYDLDSIEEIVVEDEEGNEKTIYKYYAFRLSLEYNEQVGNYIEENYETLLNNAKEHDREIHATAIREKRNKLLEESDKQMAFDRLGFEIPSTISMTTIISVLKNFFDTLKNITNGEWAEYRQALRDITTQDGFPYNVIWPDKPNN